MRTRCNQNPEEIWRRYAPSGQKEAFKTTADKYKSRSQKFAEEVTAAIERTYSWEQWVDKQIIKAKRMQRARISRILFTSLRKLKLSKVIDQIPRVRFMGHSNWDIDKFINLDTD